MNFGVLEVANSRAAPAPGWAYVADTGSNASNRALQPRKRARNAAPSQHETTEKQATKVLRELAALDRENHKDVSIPVPIRHRDNAGRVSHGKGTTPAVRKILQSQKTFSNHLTDFQALGPTPLPTVSTPVAPAVSTPRPPSGAHLTSKGTRSHKKKVPAAVVSTPTPLRRVSTATATPQPIKAEPDTPMPDAPSLVLSQGSSKDPVTHPDDKSPLLVSRIPGLPSQAEIQKLLNAPPLSYEEARGSWTEEDRRKPVRVFCEVCGYWGRVRCMRCGGKVCALECLGTHQEECFTRYGA